MAELNLSVEQLFRRAFGQGRGYDANQVYQAAGSGAAYEYEANAGAQEDTFFSARQALGSNLPDGRPVFMPVRVGGLLLPNEPTVYISNQKIVVQTDLVGSQRKGSVKELIGFGDYEIIIRGLAINYASYQVYPEEQVKALHDLYQRRESLQVEGAIFSLLGIYRLVITRMALPELRGVQHCQAYEFTCISDEDFTLEL